MNKLRQQINNLNDEYSISKKSGDSKRSIDGCEDLHKRFAPIYEEIKLLSRKIKVIKSLSDNESVLFHTVLIDKLKESINTINSFVLEWDKKKAGTLQTNIVDDSYMALEELEKEYSSVIEEHWLKWKEELEKSFNTEEFLLESQRDIPNLSNIYNRYMVLRREFKDKSRNTPDNVFTVQNIEAIASELKVLLEQMDFDIPPDLDEFFRHINSSNKGQAPLSLLTPSVLDWLKENNQLGGFTIHRKLY